MSKIGRPFWCWLFIVYCINICKNTATLGSYPIHVLHFRWAGSWPATPRHFRVGRRTVLHDFLQCFILQKMLLQLNCKLVYNIYKQTLKIFHIYSISKQPLTIPRVYNKEKTEMSQTCSKTLKHH